MTNRCEIAVIGAGPAGSCAADAAARAGGDVLLLDKCAMPRHKLCGGGVSQQALGYLGEPLPESLIDTRCYGCRVRYGARVREERAAEPVAVMVHREHFDHYLVTRAVAAGARFDVHEVTGIRQEAGGCVLVTRGGREIGCRVAIIAEGTAGRLTRVVRPIDNAWQSGVCVESRVPIDRLSRYRRDPDIIDVEFGVVPGGYGWVFDHGAFCSVGIGGLRAHVKDPRRALDEYCAGVEIDVERREVHGHLIPCGGLPRRIVADGLILAGDAAGFVDPFLGEGIAYAIRSGQLAGEVAACAVKEQNVGEHRLAEYARRCDKEFGRDLRYALRLWRLVSWRPDVCMDLLLTRPGVLARFLDVPAGRGGYREFLLWVLARLPLLYLRRGHR